MCLVALKGLTAAFALLISCRVRPGSLDARLGTAIHCSLLSRGDQRDAIVALVNAGAPISMQVSLNTRWLQALFGRDGDDRVVLISEEQFDRFRPCHVTRAVLAVITFQGYLLEYLLPSRLDAVFFIELIYDSVGRGFPPVHISIHEIHQGHREWHLPSHSQT